MDILISFINLLVLIDIVIKDAMNVLVLLLATKYYAATYAVYVLFQNSRQSFVRNSIVGLYVA